jgi:hypothetical protein
LRRSEREIQYYSSYSIALVASARLGTERDYASEHRPRVDFFLLSRVLLTASCSPQTVLQAVTQDPRSLVPYKNLHTLKAALHVYKTALLFVEEGTMSSIEKFSSFFPFFFFICVPFHRLDDILRNSCRRNLGRSLALALS